MRIPTLYGALPLGLAAVSLSACTAPVGTSGIISIPPNAAQICAQQCQTIGMRLTAVAIMASNVGCVCQHATPARSAASGVDDGATASATTAAGMVTILLEQQRRQGPPSYVR